MAAHRQSAFPFSATSGDHYRIGETLKHVMEPPIGRQIADLRNLSAALVASRPAAPARRATPIRAALPRTPNAASSRVTGSVPSRPIWYARAREMRRIRAASGIVRKRSVLFTPPPCHSACGGPLGDMLLRQAPLQLWLSLLGPQRWDGVVARDGQRAFAAWRGEDVVFLLPTLRHEHRWRGSGGLVSWPSKRNTSSDSMSSTSPRPARYGAPT